MPPATREELEAMPIHDLALRARRRALRRLDVVFLWRLMRTVPVAEAGAGHMGDAMADVTQAGAHLGDVHEASEGETGELMRPFFVDYLLKHPEK
jgi:hypothetical protein